MSSDHDRAEVLLAYLHTQGIDKKSRAAFVAAAERIRSTYDQNRVLAFHRWVEGEGHDVIVVVHLSTFNRFDYRIGFPGGGDWREVFNSDVYENWVNPGTTGNGGRVGADPQPMHGFSHSAGLVLPANSILVFAR